MPIKVQKAARTPSTQNQERNSLWTTIIKILILQNKGYQKASKEKQQSHMLSRLIRITVF